MGCYAWRKKICNDLEKLLDQEEILVVLEIAGTMDKGRDRNISFYHTSTVIKGAKKKVLDLWNEYGEWCFDQSFLLDMTFNFFKQLYTAGHESNKWLDIQSLIILFPTMSEDMPFYRLLLRK